VHRSRLRLQTALAGLAALVLTTPAAAHPALPPLSQSTPAPLTLALDPIDASGIRGSASIDVHVDGEQRTLLMLHVEGLVPHQMYVVYLRSGTPDAPSAGFGVLGSLEADADGRANLQSEALTASAAGEAIDLSLELLADGEHFLEIRSGDGEVLATGAIPPAAGPPTAADISQALNFVGQPGASGSVRVALPAGRGRPGAAILTIEAAGLRPGTRYTAHLHAGAPSMPSASVGQLGSAGTDASGRLRMQATEVAASASGMDVQLSADLLFDGAHFIDVHGSDGTLVATSSLPRMEPTGIGVVDASLAAVQRGDVDGLVGLVRFSELPCGPLTPEGIALVPECLEGEPTGSIVQVLPAAACEGYWARDPRPALASFVEHAGAPYAVVRGPETPLTDALWPAAEYLVVFAPREGSFVAGLALYVAGNDVVAVQAGCTTPEQLVRYGDGPLPVIWRPSTSDAPATDTALVIQAGGMLRSIGAVRR
jgi:hypothetical protein